MRLFRRRPDRARYTVDHHGECADTARIALALSALDYHLVVQSEMYAEDRNDELCDALLEVREILAPSVVTAAGWSP